MEFDETYTTGKVYAIMTDGTLNDSDLGTYILYGTLKTIVDDSTVIINVSTNSIGEDTYTLADGLEPVLVDDDANYEEDCGVAFILNDSGEISGLWVIEAAD
jgi:hypothetical protein